MGTGVKTSAGRFVWHDHMSGGAEKAKAFYGHLLGWETEVWKPGELDYPMIVANGQMHGGFGPAQGGAPSHWLGHVAVDDVDEAIARAEDAGGTVIAPAMDIPEVGRMAVLADPQGAAFSVFAPTTEGPTSEGTFVWDELLTADVEDAKRFYGKVVGWTTSDMDMGENVVYTLFKRTPDDDNGSAGAMQKPPDMPVSAWITYIGTDDVDATAAKTTELGGQEIRSPFDVPGVGRLAILADPTGAVFGIFKPSTS
jgi:predicted enzyme related to lactoylglutathione lyase